MTELFLHVGLPKCGSTTLQRRVLRDLPGYLGMSPRSRSEHDLANQLRVMDFRAPTDMLRSDLAEWSSRVKEFGRQSPHGRQLIVSSESLSQKPGIRTALSLLCDGIWAPGKIKVLMIFRNQPDWMASVYAQHSDRKPGASQSGFEAEVLERLGRASHHLDWSSWVESLSRTVGAENTCFLLLEDMQTADFWRQFFAFSQIDGFDPNDVSVAKIPKANQRRSRDNVWLLREWGEPRQDPELDKRDAAIEMTERLRERVLQICRPFNDRLAAQLGREDLFEKGY